MKEKELEKIIQNQDLSPEAKLGLLEDFYDRKQKKHLAICVFLTGAVFAAAYAHSLLFPSPTNSPSLDSNPYVIERYEKEQIPTLSDTGYNQSP